MRIQEGHYYELSTGAVGKAVLNYLKFSIDGYTFSAEGKHTYGTATIIREVELVTVAPKIPRKWDVVAIQQKNGELFFRTKEKYDSNQYWHKSDFEVIGSGIVMEDL